MSGTLCMECLRDETTAGRPRCNVCEHLFLLAQIRNLLVEIRNAGQVVRTR